MSWWKKSVEKPTRAQAVRAPRRFSPLWFERLESRDLPAAFIPGDLVVVKVGDGSSSLNAQGTAVFLDEYSVSGTFIQEIALPTATAGGNKRLVLSGTTASEGLLTRSADNHYLLMTGYTASPGATVLNTTSATVNRTVARINYDGTVDTSMALTDFASNASPRSAAGDTGNRVWLTGGSGGVRFATYGNTTSTQVSSTVSDTRQAAIFAGQLYTSAAGGSIRVGAVGSGLPVAAGQSTVNLPGLTTSGAADSFYLADLSASISGLDTLYVADENGGILKYSPDVNGNWVARGSADTGATYSGLTATVNGSTVTLYATRNGSDLVSLTDSTGATGNLAGTPTVLVSAAANTAFRGVSLATAVAPTITSANSATLTVGTTGSFQATASGSPTITFAETTNKIPSGLSFDSSSGLLSGNADLGTGGIYNLVFTATNGVSPDASQNFKLTVQEAPTFTSAATTTFTVSQPASFQLTSRGFPAPTFSVSSGSLPAGLSLNASTGFITGTPQPGTGGDDTIKFTATNGVSPDDIQTFDLQIDEAPQITSPGSADFNVGVSGSFTLASTGFPAATYSITSGNPPASISLDPVTGIISGTPVVGDGNAYNLTITATNSVGADAKQAFILKVFEEPQFLGPFADTFLVGIDHTFPFAMHGYPSPLFSLEDGTLPDGLDLNTSTGAIEGSAATGTTGTSTVTISATNGVGNDTSADFTITIYQLASFTSADNTSFQVGNFGTFTVGAFGIPAATLSLTAGTPPSGVTFDPSTGILSGTPDVGTAGAYPLTFTAHNAGGDVKQTFTLNVKEPPAFTSDDNATFTAGQANTFALAASGFFAPTFSLDSGTLPNGVSLNKTTGVLSGNPTAGTGGVYPVTFRAANGTLPDATLDFTLTVNEAPAIISTNATTFLLDTTGSFTVAARGYPAPALSLTDGTPPNGVTFDPVTNKLAGIPTETGDFVLTFQAQNALGTDTQTFTLRVTQFPGFTNVDTAEFNAGVLASFQLQTTGFPAATYSITAGTLPAGLNLDTNTGAISGTPEVGSGGVYNLQFKATNGTAPDAFMDVTFTVFELPHFTNTPSATFTVGVDDSFPLTAVGYPVPLFDLPTGTLPDGLALDTTTGIISGNPSVGTGGTYHFTFTVTSTLGSDSQDFQLTVREAPSFISPDHTNFIVGQSNTFTVAVSQFGSPTLALASGTLPQGLGFDPTTGKLTGMPAAGTQGTYQLVFQATNVVATVQQPFTLTVSTGPGFTSASSVIFAVGQKGTFQFSAAGFPAPTFQVIGGTLPSGVTLTPAGVLSGTPDAGTGARYQLTIEADNAGGSVTELFVLTVNEAPTFTSPNQAQFAVGADDTFQLALQAFPAAGILFQSGTFPAGLTYDPATETISGTPADGTGGTYTLVFKAVNSSGTTFQTVTLAVNEEPVLPAAPSATFIVGQQKTFHLAATGFPAPHFQIVAGTLPAGLALDPVTGDISGTPTAGAIGSFLVTISAVNGVGSSATTKVNLTVNALPAFGGDDHHTFIAGTFGSFSVLTSGAPAPKITLVDGFLPPGVSFDPDTGTLSGTPIAGTGGVYPLVFQADNSAGTAVQNFVLTVNETPHFTSATSANFVLGKQAGFQLTASGFPFASFTVTTGKLPAGLTLDSVSGLIGGTPTAFGTVQVTVRASNGVGTAALQTLTITVVQVPDIISADHVTFIVGIPRSFIVNKVGSPAVTLSLTGKRPAGVTFDAATGVLTGTAAAGTGGTYTLTIKAVNKAGSASQTFTLTVNEAPTLAGPDHATFTVGTKGSFQIKAAGFPAALFSVFSGTLPAGLTLDAHTGLISGTPKAGSGTVSTVTIQAASAVGKALASFTLTVNEAPHFTSPDHTSFTAGKAGTPFQVSATGYPVAAITLTGGTLPAGLSFDPDTGLLSGTPALGTAGTYTFTFQAANTRGKARQTFTLHVSGAPTFTGATDGTFSVGSTVSLPIGATGFPQPTITLVGGHLPAGLSYSKSTGLIAGTIKPGAGGTYPLTFLAKNGISPAAVERVNLTVNEAPKFLSADHVFFTVGTAGSITVVAVGFPAATLSLDSGKLPAGVTFDPATGKLHGTPKAGTGGVVTLVFRATSKAGSTTQPFTLHVNEALKAISGPVLVTLQVGAPVSLAYTTRGFPGPTFQLKGKLPAGLSLNIYTGVISGTPAAGSTGSDDIVLSARNGLGDPVTKDITITVQEAAHITSAPLATFLAGKTNTVQLHAAATPAAHFSATGLPTWLTLDAAGKLHGKPPAGSGGHVLFTVTADNGVGKPATQSFDLRVNAAPAITSAGTARFNLGAPNTFIVTATGFPAAHFSAKGLPSWAKLDPVSGVLTGVPTAAGVFHVAVTASNSVAKATAALTIKVPHPGSGQQNAKHTTAELFALPVAPTAADAVTLTATVQAAIGKPAGSVVFEIDGKTVGSASIHSGVAQLTRHLVAGTHHVVARYQGNSAFLPSDSPALTLNVTPTAAGHQTSTGFAASAFFDLTGQAPTATQLKHYQAELAQGATRTAIALEIEAQFGTPTFPGIDALTLPQLVKALYQRFAKKAPDAAVLNLYVNTLSQGATLTQVIAAIIGSKDYPA